VEETKLQKPEYLVQAFANTEPPDDVKALLNRVNSDTPGPNGQRASHYEVALGNMSTTPLLKKALAEAQIAVVLYSDYFGPAPYSAGGNAADGMQLRTVLARAGLPAYLLSVRHHGSRTAGHGIPQLRLLESGGAARSRAPVVGP
jgi:hypothetical protein